MHRTPTATPPLACVSVPSGCPPDPSQNPWWPGGAGETQLHRHSAFKVVGVNHASLHRLLQDAADRKKRDPSAQTFLVEPLLASDPGKRFFETFCRLRAHAVACSLASLLACPCWLSWRVSR